MLGIITLIIQAVAIVIAIKMLIKSDKRLNKLEEYVTQLELDVEMLIQNTSRLDK